MAHSKLNVCVWVWVGEWILTAAQPLRLRSSSAAWWSRPPYGKKEEEKKEEDEEEKKKKGLGEEDALKSASYNIWYGDQIYLG